MTTPAYTPPAPNTPQDIHPLYTTLTSPSNSDLERLRASNELRGRLRTFEGLLVGHARDTGTTWEEIAEVLEVTKQAAQQRFGGG